MAAVELATAYISLVPSLKGASQKISDELNPAAASSGAKAGDHLGSSIIGAAAKWAAPLAAAVGFGAVLKSGFDEAKDAAAGTAQLAAGIASTGNAANLSVDGLNGLASEIQNYSGQTDDSIVKSEQLLQTFTNIKNSGPDKIFDQATKASADMAAKFGGDASSQAVLLGKALNDPVKGITALTRVGVSFSDEQKKTIDAMVKTGDVAGAQKVILSELNTEFGGAAKAAGASFPGQLQRVHRAFEDLSQGVVQGFLPVMGPALEGVITILQKVGPIAADAAQKVADKAAAIGGGIKAVFDLFKTGDFTGSIGEALGIEEDSPVVGVILNIRDGVTGAFGSIKSALSGIDFGAIFGGLVSTIGPLIPQIVSLWSSMSPLQTIFQAIQPLLPQLLDVFGQLASVIGGTLSTALTTLLPVFAQLQSVFVTVFQQVLAAALPVIVQLVTMLGQTFAQLIPIVVPIISQIATLATTLVSQLAPILMNLISAVMPMVVSIFAALLPAIGPVIQMIAGLLIPIIQALMPVVVTVFGVIANVITSAMQIVQGIIQVVTGIITGNWSQVWDGLVNIVSGALSLIGNVLIGLKDIVFGALGGIGGWLVDSGKALIQGFINGISGMVGAIGDAVGGVLGAVADFFPHSPAKKGPFSGSGYTTHSGKALASDFAKGILSSQGSVESAASSIMTSASLTGKVGISSALLNSSPRNAAKGDAVNVNIHPAPGMSEETIGRVAAHSLNYQLRKA